MHPGEILQERFLTPLGLSPAALARGLRLHRSTISRILRGQDRLTPAVAARLGAFFGVPARWFVQLQAEYDAATIEAGEIPVPDITPLAIDPDLMVTPGGVVSLSALAARPAPPDEPVTVRYPNGSVALLGPDR